LTLIFFLFVYHGYLVLIRDRYLIIVQALNK